MRRIGTLAGALALTAGAVLGMAGTASAQQVSVPPDMCVGGGGTLSLVGEGPDLVCTGGWFNGFPVVIDSDGG
ncbi:hypothetical protein LWP59_22185 [Amycolatopsis acidiphila]|uniref:Secreted protein n=1 Tax=Amycolatopsis acidiphila TaxID=715473 RepID=A0A558A5M6_9PSEU|nr:hypothetical protein [Amycolatopsis acidiphila]TVT19528.1 hypothetical protein FNH06_24150 [Amycolatopsis acidiphila]UIJ56878.1 hypothetical protein LWP59_22185 [Amycolatopsis acidiphila]GHG54613.1 hypothetical protein GCM10017788_04450 [Amycolatopsis acidiphila]